MPYLHKPAQAPKTPARSVAENITSKGLRLPAVAPLQQKDGKNRKVVQRAVGFEFESSANKYVDAYDRKQIVYETPNLTLEADGDGSNMEFVTKPKQITSEALGAVDEAAILADDIVKSKGMGGQVVKENGNWKSRTAMKITDDAFKCSPQHTEGVALEDMLSYIRENYMGIRRKHLPGNDEKQLVDDQFANTVDMDVQLINEFYGDDRATHPRVLGLIQAIVMFLRNARGLPTVFISYEGPKPNFPLMHRTDFKSMFESLDEGLPTAGVAWSTVNRLPCNRESFYKAVIENNGVGKVLDIAINDFVFSEPYVDSVLDTVTLTGDGATTWNDLLVKVVKTEKSRLSILKVYKSFFDNYGDKASRNTHQLNLKICGFNNGPKLGAWLTSIISGAARDKGKDAMSPPPGIPAHKNTPQRERYGMGAYGMDKASVPGTPLALFEMRYHTEVGGTKGFAEWHNWADNIIKGAATRKLTNG